MRRKHLISCLLATIICNVIIAQSTSVTIQSPEDFVQLLNRSLILTADSGNLEQVKNLIESGADPNTTSWDGTSPLMFAAQAGHYQIARELLAYEANPNLTNSRGLTALHYACIQNRDSIAELLILNGSNPHPTDQHGLSPLHYAGAYGYTYMLYLLLSYGAHIDSIDQYGNTPLATAVYSGMTESSAYLLENWADVDRTDSKGFTPLMVAAQFNDTTLLRTLTDYGADIFKKNNYGVTALALAMHTKSTEATSFLESKGATSQEFHSETSYAELAYKNGFTELSKKLRENGSPFPKKPKISSALPYVGSTIGTNELYFLLGAKLQISNYGTTIGADFGLRPFYLPAIVERQFATYQYFEQRYFLTLSGSKTVKTIRTKKGGSLSLEAGLNGIFTFGHYSYPNTLGKPKTIVTASPTISITYQKKSNFVNIGASYLNTGNQHKQPIVFKICYGFILDYSIPKIRTKQLGWM